MEALRLLGRNITFSPFDPEVGNAVVSPDEPADGAYWTLIAQGGDAQQNAVAAEICRRLNSPDLTAKLVEAARNVVDCWGVGSLNITAMSEFINDLREALRAAEASPPEDNAIGAAEREVGRYIYRRIEALMDAKAGTAEGAELVYLAKIAESVEEWGDEGCGGEALAPFPSGRTGSEADTAEGKEALDTPNTSSPPSPSYEELVEGLRPFASLTESHPGFTAEGVAHLTGGNEKRGRWNLPIASEHFRHAASLVARAKEQTHE